MAKVETKGFLRVLPNIKQEFWRVESFEDKKDLLVKLLRQHEAKRILVFCNTANSCNFVHHHLQQHKIDPLALHGEIPYLTRATKFKSFVRGESDVLLCTDVVSRGMDTVDVDMVIIFDFPSSLTDYIHRVGRTGRIGRKGTVVSLVHNKDLQLVRQIQLCASKGEQLETGSEEDKVQLTVAS
eukprot:Colp12_sorted_trinity150504_noHs@30992